MSSSEDPVCPEVGFSRDSVSGGAVSGSFEGGISGVSVGSAAGAGVVAESGARPVDSSFSGVASEFSFSGPPALLVEGSLVQAHGSVDAGSVSGVSSELGKASTGELLSVISSLGVGGALLAQSGSSGAVLGEGSVLGEALEGLGLGVQDSVSVSEGLGSGSLVGSGSALAPVETDVSVPVSPSGSKVRVSAEKGSASAFGPVGFSVGPAAVSSLAQLGLEKVASPAAVSAPAGLDPVSVSEVSGEGLCLARVLASSDLVAVSVEDALGGAQRTVAVAPQVGFRAGKVPGLAAQDSSGPKAMEASSVLASTKDSVTLVSQKLVGPSGKEAGLTSFPVAAEGGFRKKEVLPQKSWASVASKASLSKFNFEVSIVEGKEVVEVPEEALEGAPLWEDFVIGRFASSAPHIAKIHMIVNKIWTLGDKSIKIDAYRINDTTVKFRIRNASARLRTLRRGMWNICEIPMVVSKWSPIVEEAQPAVKSMPMWVKILNVPHAMFTWKGISFLASPVGTPLRLHPETELVSNFDEAKVFIEVDLSKELPKSYVFKLRGNEVIVSFEYPWLPERCDTCTKWGHGADGCLVKSGKKPTTKPVIVESNSVKDASPNQGLREGPKNKEMGEAETVVALEVTKNLLVNQQEDVEIIENSTKGKISELEVEDDSGWEITSSGRKKSRKSRPLVFGQVTILSPSRFDVLQEENALVEVNIGSSTQKAEEPTPKLNPELDKVGESKKEDSQILSHIKTGIGEGGLRPSLPRNSKSTLKPREGVPSFIKKRSSRKKN